MVSRPRARSSNFQVPISLRISISASMAVSQSGHPLRRCLCFGKCLQYVSKFCSLSYKLMHCAQFICCPLLIGSRGGHDFWGYVVQVLHKNSGCLGCGNYVLWLFMLSIEAWFYQVPEGMSILTLSHFWILYLSDLVSSPFPFHSTVFQKVATHIPLLYTLLRC